MVMKRNMMRKNLARSILRSLGRYLAIVAIIALGSAMFIGLKVTKTDMVATGQEYLDRQNFYALRLLNTYGWTERQLAEVEKLEGIDQAEGSVYVDAYASIDGGEDGVYRCHAIPEKINKVYLLSGRMPESANECLVDGERYGEDMIGKTVVLTDANSGDTMESFAQHRYTVVGRISTPLYMDMTRGSTSLGDGMLTTYLYFPKEAFCTDYYTEIYVTLPGSWVVYSEELDTKLEQLADQFETELIPLAQERFAQVMQDAKNEYADGLATYEENLQKYLQEKAEVEEKLADALRQLTDGRQELEENRLQLEEAEKELADAQAKIDAAKAELDAAKQELENAKAEAYTQMADAYTQLFEQYQLISSSLSQVEDGIAQIDDGLAQIEDGLAQINSNLPLLQLMLEISQSKVTVTQAALDAALAANNEALAETLRQTLAEQTQQRDDYQKQMDTLLQTQQQLQEQKETLTEQRSELVQTQKQLNDGLDAVNLGFQELETQEKVAQNQFAAAEAKINAGYLELQSGQTELEKNLTKVQEGQAAFAQAEAELEDGFAQYEQQAQQAEEEFAAAQEKLDDAKQQLADAATEIESLADPEVFALTRNTNVGYLALDNNSDIVSGVAKVMPVFFLLIAALVCITTMTRMVEEERTQIGTLKALGHSNAAIIGKYLWYSASAAVIGCGIGVAVGSTFFPALLWNAYGIIFNIQSGVVLKLDWGLCIGITVAYLAVSTFVTWLCCRRTLQEVPAQLIRPKAPETGKKIWLEKLPFWKKLSFLNKVMLRNVLRYRQRFAMMVIGIGGCTALLLTGFGMRDTIVDLANIQFSQVSQFDMEVYFSEGQSEEQQQKFLEFLQDTGVAETAGFVYQSSAELHFDSKMRDVYLIAAQPDVCNYLSFQKNGETVPLPGKDEAILSVGVAELLNIRVGDRITLRDSDLHTLDVVVTGIYENYVQNYVLVGRETLQGQWETVPAEQVAYLKVNGEMSVHEANAYLTALDGVMRTTVCQDTAEMVDSMMDALDLVIIVVVVCAGLLGAIVLYNLTNININERIREIATIKVLGFRASETSAYVFKENILLTILGIAFGLPLGRWFLGFVMDNIKIDMVWFKVRLTVPSYLYAVALSLICAAVVDLIFHRKLDRINMAEALKSVE